jgi:hypothetical protein
LKTDFGGQSCNNQKYLVAIKQWGVLDGDQIVLIAI